MPVKRKIPVSKHIKKFLEYYFPHPYTYKPTDFIGALIAGVLKKGYRVRVKKKAEAEFTIILKDNDVDRLGKFAEWEDCLNFNKAIHSIFLTVVYTHMDISRKLDIEKSKVAMIQLLEEMGITEDDINFESLYREYGRKKKYPKTTSENIVNHLTKKTMVKLSSENGQIVL
jgi:hypothetical protein